MTATTIRRAAALVTTAAVWPLLAAGPAAADVPEGWSDPEPVGLVQLFVVIGLIPLGLALLLVLAVYLPSMIRGERVAPGAQAPDEWFGGPRHAAGELESSSGSGTTGGASGGW